MEGNYFWLQSSIMQSTRVSSAPLLQVPLIRTFILHSGDEAQCTDKAFVTMRCLFCG